MKKKGVELNQTLGFMMSSTTDSFLSNKDAEGVYFSDTNKLIKGEKKINFCKYPKSINKSKFIITHQRISTSGLEEKYAQPFKSGKNGLVLAHNGIIDQFKKTEGSDTHGYFFKHFIPEFNKLKGNRDKRIIKAIKNTMKDCSGSYSIVIYDTKKSKLYYFKNMSKSISFFKSDDDKILYFSTKESNKDYLHFFNRKFSEMTIKEDRIYKIEINKIISVKEVGRIPKEPDKRIAYNSTYSYGYDEGYNCNYQRGLYDRNRSYTYNLQHGNIGLADDIEDLLDKTNDNTIEEKVRINKCWGKYFEKEVDLKSKQPLEELIFETSTLEDLGYTKISTEDYCSECGLVKGEFLDEDRNLLCDNCLEIRKERISFLEEDICDYLNYEVGI